MRTQTGRLIKKNSAKAQHLNLPIIDFTNSEQIKKKFTKKFLSTPRGEEELSKLVDNFILISNKLKKGQIIVPPRSALKIRLHSFCTNSARVSPHANEVYSLAKGYPPTPHIQSIMQALNHSKEFENFDQNEIQELIWNLANRTHFDNLPLKHQSVLARVAPSSQISMRLGEIQNQLKQRLLPSEVNSLLNLVEGKYYKFKDFKTRMDKLVSTYKLKDDYIASEVPETNLLAQTEGPYNNRVLTLYNPTDKHEQFDLGQYYLKPLRPDVQPLVLSSVAPDLSYVKDTLNNKVILIKRFVNLNPEQKKFVLKHPKLALYANNLSDIAKKEARARYPQNELLDGEGDAFRHFVWAAMLTHTIGDTMARTVLNNHEPPGFSKSTQMDHFNNNKGVLAAKNLKRKYGDKNIPSEVFFNLAEEKIKSGELMFIKPKKNKK